MSDRLTSVNYWEEQFKKYRLPVRFNPNQWWDNYIFHKLLRTHLPSGKCRILEVGVTPGEYLVYFKKDFDYDVTGIDFSPSGIKVTRKNFELNDVSGELVLADFLENPFKSEAFDVVFSAGFIEHFKEPKIVINEIERILKKGGIVVTTVPNMHSFSRTAFDRFINPENFEIVRMINLSDLKHIHNKFKEIYASYMGAAVILTMDNIIGDASIYLLNKIISVVGKGLQINYFGRYISPHIIFIGRRK